MLLIRGRERRWPAVRARAWKWRHQPAGNQQAFFQARAYTHPAVQ